jgi:hypothetical protein
MAKGLYVILTSSLLFLASCVPSVFSGGLEGMTQDRWNALKMNCKSFRITNLPVLGKHSKIIRTYYLEGKEKPYLLEVSNIENGIEKKPFMYGIDYNENGSADEGEILIDPKENGLNGKGYEIILKSPNSENDYNPWPSRKIGI